MNSKILAILAVGCCIAIPGYTQSNTMSAADKKFVHSAAEGGMAEVQLGQLAEQKASSQDVKDFGHRMVSDHSQANDKLKSLASNKGITLPSSVNAKDKALYDRLSALSGSEFDRAYMNAMVKDHTTDVSEFQKESNTAKDQDLREFASMTLPTLKDHLRMAQDVDHKLGSSASRQ
ncbi:MAG TPA: DUF4142 domain-containing protein [Bryobacteraceae bacterium]|nr:DUF4142 domain-containing protein [Bryobacteraceae bacterium]